MRYQIYTNETIDLSREYSFSDGYRPGAHMKLAYEGLQPSNPDSADSVLESLFYKFNMDHPVDYRAHSLSVGDVVVLFEDDWSSRTAYSCMPIGWTKLENFDPSVKNADWIDADSYHGNPRYYTRVQNIMRSLDCTFSAAEAKIIEWDGGR
jgi:hypothetical protein